MRFLEIINARITVMKQETPASPVLFVLYIRLLATAIEAAVPGVPGVSFVDDQGLVTAASSVKEACKTLQRAAKVAIEWGVGERHSN
jgi:hypothetical protein